MNFKINSPSALLFFHHFALSTITSLECSGIEAEEILRIFLVLGIFPWRQTSQANLNVVYFD